MKYSIQELKAELLDQRYNLSYTSPTNWVVDYDDVLTAIGNLEKELLDYIQFIDNAKTHSPSIEMKVKYQVYKEILGETDKER